MKDLFAFTNYFISKAKIRETIQKLKRLSDLDNGNEYCEFTIHILKQLLGEEDE